MACGRQKLRYTLLGDGSSDRALMPVLEWLFRHLADELLVEGMWADVSRAPVKLNSLKERSIFALSCYPCDILFIHRDAEAQPPETRYKEVDAIRKEIHASEAKTVAVVPVRMTESWLLIDERAIRFGSGNPHGCVRLKLPRVSTLEKLPDPKQKLKEMLMEASELHGRHRRKFDVSHGIQRVASEIGDYSPLLHLKSFQRLKSDLITVLQQLGVTTP